MSRSELLDQACHLAHDLEMDLRLIERRISKGVEGRLSGNHFRARGINIFAENILGASRDLATDLEFGKAVACENTLGSNITAARRLAAYLDYARAISRDLVRDLALDRPKLLSGGNWAYSAVEKDARRLIRDFARARNKALNVAKAVARFRGTARDLSLLRDLENLLAAFTAKDHEETLQEMTAAVASASNDIARGALRLTGLAAKLLPAGERSRYCEEWRAELLALSEETATPRREQIRYGWRQLRQSLSLRFALLWEPTAKRERA